MSLTAVLTLRPSRQAADAVFATVGLAVMAEIWRTWDKELFGAYNPSFVDGRSATGPMGGADCVILEGGEHSNSAAH